MKIEWASHFRSDGTRRQPPPSTMHGWLAKMRGTLTGNEDLRSRGMKEMRDARRYRQTKAQMPKRKPTARRDPGPSHLFGTLNPKPRPVPVGRGSQSRQNSTQRIVGQGRPPAQGRPVASRKGSGSHHSSQRSNARPSTSRRPTATPQRRQSGR